MPRLSNGQQLPEDKCMLSVDPLCLHGVRCVTDTQGLFADSRLPYWPPEELGRNSGLLVTEPPTKQGMEAAPFWKDTVRQGSTGSSGGRAFGLLAVCWWAEVFGCDPGCYTASRLPPTSAVNQILGQKATPHGEGVTCVSREAELASPWLQQRKKPLPHAE